MVGVPDIRAEWTPAAAQLWSTGGCNFLEVRVRYCVKYIVTIVFDFTVLILTVVGVRRMGGSRIGETLIDHGIIYFLLTTTVNLVVCILTIFQLSPVMSTIAAPPASCVSIMAATRLYVALHKEANARHTNAITMDQLSSASSMGKRIASFVRRATGGGARDAKARRATVINVDVSYVTESTRSAGATTLSPSSPDLEKGTAASKLRIPDF